MFEDQNSYEQAQFAHLLLSCRNRKVTTRNVAKNNGTEPIRPLKFAPYHELVPIRPL